MADLSKLPYASINARAKSTGDKSAKSQVDAKAKIDKQNNVKSSVSVLANAAADSHQDSKGKTVFNKATIEAGEGSFISQIARAEDFGANMLFAKTNGSDIYQKGDLNYARITGNDNVHEADAGEDGLNIVDVDGEGNTSTTFGATVATIDGKNNSVTANGPTVAVVEGEDNTLNTGEGDDVVFIDSESATVVDSSDEDHDIAVVTERGRTSKVDGYETVMSEDGKELVWDEKQGKYVEKCEIKQNQSPFGFAEFTGNSQSSKSSSADAPTFGLIGFTDSNEAGSTEEAPAFGFIGFINNNESSECNSEGANSVSAPFEKLFAMFAMFLAMFNFMDA